MRTCGSCSGCWTSHRIMVGWVRGAKFSRDTARDIRCARRLGPGLVGCPVLLPLIGWFLTGRWKADRVVVCVMRHTRSIWPAIPSNPVNDSRNELLPGVARSLAPSGFSLVASFRAAVGSFKAIHYGAYEDVFRTRRFQRPDSATAAIVVMTHCLRDGRCEMLKCRTQIAATIGEDRFRRRRS